LAEKSWTVDLVFLQAVKLNLILQITYEDRYTTRAGAVGIVRDIISVAQLQETIRSVA
jgi:hypothetical protein